MIHLNTYAGNGGAGRACLRLNQALQDQGIDSDVYINFSLQERTDVHSLSAGFFRKWFAATGIILENLLAKILVKPLRIPFSFPLWGRDISNYKALRQADIIHLHWINHAFLRPKDLAKLSRLNKPIVWTFHDSNAFTGGCHVRYNCEHFQQECGNCPVLKNANPNDWSHKIWLDKQKAYQRLKFTVIAPSNWMAQSVRQSKLLKSFEVKIIPNTLETAVFKPTSKTEARQKLGIDPDKFILMSGFMPSRKDLHKGTSYLIEVITILAEQHKSLTEQFELLIFGNRDEKDLPEFGIKTTFLGKIADDDQLALYYSATDVFLVPSLEDNLPYTVMESLSCGTPVVAFKTGGIPDMVKHKENGYLAQYRSTSDLAEGIRWVYEHPDRNLLNANARKAVEDQFMESNVAQKHIELYQSLLSR